MAYRRTHKRSMGWLCEKAGIHCYQSMDGIRWYFDVLLICMWFECLIYCFIVRDQHKRFHCMRLHLERRPQDLHSQKRKWQIACVGYHTYKRWWQIWCTGEHDFYSKNHLIGHVTNVWLIFYPRFKLNSIIISPVDWLSINPASNTCLISEQTRERVEGREGEAI